MALLGNNDRGYTKTDSGNFLTKISHFVSYIPGIGPLAKVLMPVVLATGIAGAALDAGKWLVRGKLFSALTALVGGSAETAVNAVLGGIPGTAIKLGSGLATGHTIGAHARKLAEVGMGGLGELVGAKPQVLRSYTAGIGSISAPAAPGPGRFVSQVAASRGEDPNVAYERLKSGQSDHVAALEAAAAQPQMGFGR